MLPTELVPNLSKKRLGVQSFVNFGMADKGSYTQTGPKEPALALLTFLHKILLKHIGVAAFLNISVRFCLGSPA